MYIFKQIMAELQKVCEHGGHFRENLNNRFMAHRIIWAKNSAFTLIYYQTIDI